MTRKQEIMVTIVDIVTRNVAGSETRSALDLIASGSRFTELQLIHEIPYLMLNPVFTVSDLRWLISQDRSYLKNGTRTKDFERIRDYISELRELVPEEIKAELVELDEIARSANISDN